MFEEGFAVYAEIRTPDLGNDSLRKGGVNPWCCLLCDTRKEYHPFPGHNT